MITRHETNNYNKLFSSNKNIQLKSFSFFIAHLLLKVPDSNVYCTMYIIVHTFLLFYCIYSELTHILHSVESGRLKINADSWRAMIWPNIKYYIRISFCDFLELQVNLPLGNIKNCLYLCTVLLTSLAGQLKYI